MLALVVVAVDENIRQVFFERELDVVQHARRKPMLPGKGFQSIQQACDL